MKTQFPLSKIRVTFLVFVLIFQFRHLSAQDNLSDSLVKERIQTIQKMLDDGKTDANRWRNGWIIGYSALTVGQSAAYYMSTDENKKNVWALGAVTTLACVGIGYFTPMIAANVPDQLAQIPENNKEEELQKLYKAEELLKLSALQEKNGRSWKPHALYGIINAAGGVLVCVAFKQSFWSGFTNFALSSVVSEAQIWTQPTKAMKDYQSYCRKYKAGESLEVYKTKPEWHVGIYPSGIALSFKF